MNRHYIACDGNGCDCEREENEDARAWLRLMVVGGHPHEVFDFCPSCSAAFRALMPRGPERAERTTPAPPPLELEPESAPSPEVGPEPDPES